LPPNARFIYVPLQVEGDSQVNLHSRFESMRSFMAFLIESVETYKKKSNEIIYLVVKRHPLAPLTEITQHPSIVWAQSHHSNLVEDALAVITINSTVGFSALKNRKNVGTTGK